MDLAKEIRERKENRNRTGKGGFAVEGMEKPLKTRKIEGIDVGMISQQTDDKRAVRSKVNESTARHTRPDEVLEIGDLFALAIANPNPIDRFV